MPFVDDGEFVDIAIELDKSGVEVRGIFAEQENMNGNVVMEGVGPQVVRRLFKVFVDP